LGKKSVVVGDLVSVVGDISGAEGSLARVVSVLARKNSLTRTIDDHANDERVIVANVDQIAIVIATTNPEPREGFVDRALVVAYDQGIEPIIIMTKQDLANGDEFLETYKDLEIKVFKIDKSSDLGKLQKTLANKITVLIGHSGVGKSTLVNNLLESSKNKSVAVGDDSKHRATGDVNEVTGRGRHTSSSAIALPLLTSFWAITELIVVRLLFFSYSTDNTLRRLSSLAKFWFVKPGQSFNAQVASLCEQFFGQCEIALVNSGNAEITLEG